MARGGRARRLTAARDRVAAVRSTVVQIKANNTATTNSFTSLSVSGLVPGATPTYALLTISNTGTVTSTWTMSTTATSNQLSTDLRLGVVKIAGATCDATAFTGGTTLYTEAANLASATVAARSLASGGSENLCFKVSLPSSSTNTSAGLTSTATFTVAATSPPPRCRHRPASAARRSAC